MIISHKYRYVFVRIPHTASTTIHHELVENYAGEHILTDHAPYSAFLQGATEDEKKYFVFAAVRNPLDEAVSIYFKHKNFAKFSAETAEQTEPTERDKELLADGTLTRQNLRRFRYIMQNNTDFVAYFRKFYRIPFSNILSLTEKHCDYIIRFEQLQEGFAEVLQRMDIEQKRPLPVRNKTGGRDRDFTASFPPEIQAQAKRVFGPFMARWGYEFPAEWGPYSPSPADRIRYRSAVTARNLFWKHVRWNQGFLGRVGRRLR